MERVFITGASSGIGAALAKAYAARGAKLGLVARRETELQQLAATLPCESLVLTADVRDGAAVQRAAAHFIDRFGSPDVVIANAGVSHGTATECAEDLAAFAEIIDINVLGMVRTSSPSSPGCVRAVAGRWSASPASPGFAACLGRAPTAPRKPRRSVI